MEIKAFRDFLSSSQKLWETLSGFCPYSGRISCLVILMNVNVLVWKP